MKQIRFELETQVLDAGPISSHWHLTQQGVTPPSTATIRRILTRANMIKPQSRKRRRSNLIRFQAEAPNETWQSDFAHWSLANAVDLEILNFLNDHSRYLLACQALRPVTGQSVVGVFFECVTEYGPPPSTLTDNEFVSTSKYRGGKNSSNTLWPTLESNRKTAAQTTRKPKGKSDASTKPSNTC